MGYTDKKGKMDYTYDKGKWNISNGGVTTNSKNGNYDYKVSRILSKTKRMCTVLIKLNRNK